MHNVNTTNWNVAPSDPLIDSGTRSWTYCQQGMCRSLALHDATSRTRKESLRRLMLFKE